MIHWHTPPSGNMTEQVIQNALFNTANFDLLFAMLVNLNFFCNINCYSGRYENVRSFDLLDTRFRNFLISESQLRSSFECVTFIVILWLFIHISLGKTFFMSS